MAEILPIYHPNVAKYAPIIEKYAKKYKVPATVIGNVIMAESSGNPMAYNYDFGHKSRGLMQLTEATAASLGFSAANFDQLFNPDTAIQYGTKLLAHYRDLDKPLFSADISETDKWKIIASAYNQGPEYGIVAMSKLGEQGRPTTWEQVLDYMLINPIPRGYKVYIKDPVLLARDKTGKRPMSEHARTYGPKAVGMSTEEHLLFKTGLGLGMIALLGLAGYVGFKLYQAQQQNLQVTANPNDDFLNWRFGEVCHCDKRLNNFKIEDLKDGRVYKVKNHKLAFIKRNRFKNGKKVKFRLDKGKNIDNVLFS